MYILYLKPGRIKKKNPKIKEMKLNEPNKIGKRENFCKKDNKK